MAIYRKSKFEINLMKQAGNIVALVHAAMKDAVKVGDSYYAAGFNLDEVQ